MTNIIGKIGAGNKIVGKISGMTNAAVEAELERIDGRIDTIISTPVEGVSEQEIIDARQGKGSLGENISEVKSQLAQVTTDLATVTANVSGKIQTGADLPTAAEEEAMAEGDMWFVLSKPLSIPYSDSFEVASPSWENFTAYKYGTYDSETDIRVSGGKGVMNCRSSIEGSSAGINAVFDLPIDFTGGKKYRISYKETNQANSGVQTTGFSLVTGNNFAGYVNATIASGGTINPGNVLTLAHLDTTYKYMVRKIVNDVVASTRYVGTSGFGTTDISLSGTVQQSVSIEISSTTLKITINGITYVNIAEDFSNLNSENVKIVFFAHGGYAVQRTAHIDDFEVTAIS